MVGAEHVLEVGQGRGGLRHRLVVVGRPAVGRLAADGRHVAERGREVEPDDLLLVGRPRDEDRRVVRVEMEPVLRQREARHRREAAEIRDRHLDGGRAPRCRRPAAEPVLELWRREDRWAEGDVLGEDDDGELGRQVERHPDPLEAERREAQEGARADVADADVVLERRADPEVDRRDVAGGVEGVGAPPHDDLLPETEVERSNIGVGVGLAEVDDGPRSGPCSP